jgi:hypothetical protein
MLYLHADSDDETNRSSQRLVQNSAYYLGQTEYRIVLLGPGQARAIPFEVMDTGSSVLPEKTAVPDSSPLRSSRPFWNREAAFETRAGRLANIGTK